ncbi:MAG: HlyC/CorC family transporter [Chlamydiales bacterium]|nr:HlyC/CorC family transporter [Chlamydiales bacterium]
MNLLQSLILPLVFILGASSITALTKTLQILGRIQSKKEFRKKPHYFFAYTFIKKLFSKDPWDNLFYLLSFTKHFLRLLYSTTFFLYLLSQFLKSSGSDESTLYFTFSTVLICIAIIIGVGLFFDFFFRFLVNFNPPLILRIVTPATTFFLFLFSPITFLFLKAQRALFQRERFIPHGFSRARVKDKILEVVHESELTHYLEPFDRRIISAVASFRDRIAREIMVPRIDVFTLSVNQTVHEAAKKFVSEGYSRIPVYKDSVDSIIGVLLYKDVMEYYVKSSSNNDTSPLNTPLEKLVKPVLYSPETKKISVLLQEFRSKQIHLAIVVDEYGGTEGIVTIEDILEELVGEIADEFDSIEEEKLHTPHPNGGWVVDGKMTILDIEKELGVLIPTSPEYDTIGGYIFHRAGTIPSKGWKIHNDNFDLEVVASSERVIDKALIIPSKT